MQKLTIHYILYTASLLFFLSLFATGVNFFSTQYPGNNYFPPHTFFIGLILLLIYTGCLIQFGQTSIQASQSKDLMLLLLVMSVIAFATNAAQYTPFKTIDQSIINIEQSLHISVKAILSWSNHQPFLQKILIFAYNSLLYQMAYIPLFLIMIKRRKEVHEYYFLLLFSALIGFTFYYFFPTTAPASVITSPYFHAEQQATGLKFMQIHQHIQPTTLEGGLIALPSFHVIWAWICVYSLRHWRIAVIALFPINLLIVLSCVLLGWHYPTDVLGALIVILLAHKAYHRITAPLLAPKLTYPVLSSS